MRQGTHVKITICSGIDSEKQGYVISKQNYIHTIKDSFEKYLAQKTNWSIVAICKPGMLSTCEYYTVTANNRLIEVETN